MQHITAPVFTKNSPHDKLSIRKNRELLSRSNLQISKHQNIDKNIHHPVNNLQNQLDTSRKHN